MRHPQWFVGSILLLALGAWLASGARGDEPALADRVAALEREVAALKARLDKLEAPAPRRPNRVAQMEDLNNLRNLVGLVVVSEKPPMKDGALDVYAFVRTGDITPENYRVFRSARSGTGPTKEEIERGDYANFPWERRRGEWKRAESVPLLWEKQPDAEGNVLVGLSDGSAQTWDKERLQKALRE